MARNSSTRWYAALAVLVVFVLLAWLLGAVLTLTDGERVTLRVGLIVLGLVGAVSLLWYLRPRDAGEQEAPSEKGDELLPLVTAARTRLGRSVFDAKPLILVLGPEGSCKSTIVLRSGVDPELLAGDASAGSDLPPKTRVANFWLVKDAVIAEAGGGTFNDAASWGRLVRALRSPRLAAAVGRGEASPRAAVVCVSCDQLRATNGGGDLDALAKVIRERLTEAARAWGMAVPVYVVFTKADRIAHFESWAAPLTREEIQSVVGAALPFDETATAMAGAATKAAGTYAERVVPRVEGAVARLVSSLAGHRLSLMGRESQGELRLKSYELPREMGKLAPEISRFLVEICRPVHSGVSPQLRGFYFVGARPVTVEVPVAGSAPKVEAPRNQASSATNVFTPQAIAAATSGAGGGAAKTTTKRVPQWVFAERLFPDVFLADRGAAAMARGGVRVATVRRALLGMGIAAALLVALGVTRSWMGNRALANRTADAARDVAALPVVSGAAIPSGDALRRLEALRVVLDTLGQYEAAGVPGRLGWGLWIGDSLLAAGQRTWLEGYRRQLHDVAATALVDSLRALPVAPRPTDDYGRTYNWLKAYLLMSTESSKSTPEFLAPELIESWKRGAEIDADILALARPQFEYYATLLAQRNPWPQDADMRIVGRTRVFLTGFSGSSQIYLNMITRAEKAAPPIKLAEAVPNLAGVMTAPAEVRGAFTKAGWAFMETAFQNSSDYFGSESWVVGDATAAKSMDQDAIIAELRTRYRSEYVQQWRDVVRRSAVMQPSSIKDAARRVGAVSDPVSPLLGLVGVVSDNTDVDSLVRVAFQPTHIVVPPSPRDNLVNDGNSGYAGALLGLRGALEGVDLVGAPVDSAAVEAIKQKAQEAMSQVILARTAARQLSQKFKSDTAAARLAPSVVTLLESPVNGAEAALRGVARLRAPAVRPPVVAAGGGGGAPAGGGGGGGGGGDDKKKIAERAAQLNERGERICAAMAPMLGKFPFDPSATVEASVQEVTGLLAPGTGQLAAFQQEAMADLLEKQGNRWVAKPGKGPALSAPFVEFFNRAMTRSEALFDGAPAANVQFTALGIATPDIPMIALAQGTQVAPFRVNTPPAVFVWPSSTGREARLSAHFGKNKEQLAARATGEWAIFRLVAMAANATGDAEITATWNPTAKGAKPLSMRFRAQSNAPVFKRGWLGEMSCVSQVAQ